MNNSLFKPFLLISRLLLSVGSLLLMFMAVGCSSFSSHDKLMSDVIQTRNSKGAEAALNRLSSKLTKSQGTELLYLLETGELLRDAKHYDESTQFLTKAEEQVIAWERTAVSNPTRLLSYLGASTVNEKLRPYEGQDYEKTWLSMRIAMNHLAQGNWDNARVAIKRTHEREEIIANFRRKELSSIQQQAASNDWNVAGESLGGYPVDYLQSQEVLALHNSYQNAFSHYLAGFIYEALDEPSLAAPGYRKAIELNPDAAVLQDALKNLDSRMSNARGGKTNKTDVLFILERGNAPSREPIEISLPFFYKDQDDNVKVIYIAIAFPVIKPAATPRSATLKLGTESSLTATPVMNLNLMARRALRDEMPGLIFRGLTRAASKGAMQYYANETDELLGALINIFSVVTERADDRNWRALPGSISLARGFIPPGQYPLSIDGKNTGQTINIHGKNAVIPIRILDSSITIANSSYYGTIKGDKATATAHSDSLRTPESSEEEAAPPMRDTIENNMSPEEQQQFLQLIMPLFEGVN